jgi:hypothetical protein
MPITELFTYTQRVTNAAQSFMKLKDEYLDPKDQTMSFTKFIATEWQVEPDDLTVAVWEINNPTRSA